MFRNHAQYCIYSHSQTNEPDTGEAITVLAQLAAKCMDRVTSVHLQDVMKTVDQRRAKPAWRPMRRLILLVLLALLVTSIAGAAKRVTVAQLEQALTAAHAAHKPDAEIARQIGGLELSERLTEATLNRLTAYLDAGSQAALALQLLADQSAFLDPPASEIPSTAAPDDAAQQRMIEAARNYVAQTVPQLPNLFAVRTTNRYDDRPYEVKKGGWPVRAGLHLVNTSSREISIFDERTNQSTNASAANWQEQSGLISGGEFGSTLSMILSDTVNGKVTWSHWEQTPNGAGRSLPLFSSKLRLAL